MRGLEELRHLNDQGAAQFHLERYRKLRDNAVSGGHWKLARKYDGFAQDFERFLRGEISVFPDKKNRKARRFVPAVGHKYS